MLYGPPSLSKRAKIIIILLVLLIHFLLLIPFITIEFTFLPPSPLEKKAQELHKKVHKLPDDEPEEWAELKSRAMQMSAPVILADLDVDTPNDDTNTQEKEQTASDSLSTSKDLMHDTPEPSTPNTADSIAANDKQERDISAPQPTLIDIPKNDSTQVIESLIAKSIADKSADKPVENKPAPQPPAKPRTQAPAKTQMQRNKPTTKTSPAQVMAKKQPASKQLSLAQLAQGFVDHMQHEGDYTISMSGNASAKATETQLKVGRFLQRIIGAIQNSWRANTTHYPLSKPVIASIHFTIVINKNGTLNKVGIDRSSGNYLIDNYIKRIIQDASSSFPSIPDYMGHDVCSIRCTLDEIRFPEGPPGYTIR
jgi:outer membrane biosynthesis protein TonB